MSHFKLKAAVSFVLSVLLAAPALWAQQGMVRRHRLMPRAGEYYILKADLHMHTVFSDGEVWPETRVWEAWREDLDVIAITDHDDYRPHEKDVSMDLGRPYELARPLAEAMGILLIPGVEITKGNIHFNALFVKDHNAFRGKELLTALAEARRQGAFSFWNHPGWKGQAEWWPVIATAHADRLFQGIELLNGKSYYEEARPWIQQHGLTVIGNSDIHAPSLPEAERTMNLVFARERTVEGVREALWAGRTVAWDGGRRLMGKQEWVEALVRASLSVPTEVRFGGGQGSSGVWVVRNNSALSFELKPEQAPAWLEIPAVLAPAGASVALPVRRRAEAPKAPGRVKVQLEVTNAMVTETGGPLRLPLELELVF